MAAWLRNSGAIGILGLTLILSGGACDENATPGGVVAGAGEAPEGGKGAGQARPIAAPADVFLTTLSKVPGRAIIETRGFYCRLFEYEGGGNFTALMAGCLDGIRQQAVHDRANAMVNMTVASGSYDVQGSQWNSAVFLVCGDLVNLD